MIRFDATQAQKEQLSEIFNQWTALKEKLQVAFELKNKSAANQMLTGINLYENLLVKVSETTVFKPDDIQDYEILPLNGQERYTFIVINSNRYAAFCQLNELFEETKKKIARLRIISI